MHIYHRISPGSILFCIAFSMINLISCTENRQNNSNSHHKAKQKAKITNLEIHGANALYPLSQVWADEYSKNHPLTRINVFPGSSSKGLADTKHGLADLGMYSDLPDSLDFKDLISFKVAKDAVVAVMSSKNPAIHIIQTKGISKQSFYEIYVNGRIKRWDQFDGISKRNRINIFTRSDASGAASVWAEYLGCKQESLRGTGVYGDAGMSQVIRTDAYALGYDNLRYVYDITTADVYPGLQVVPIDLNDNGRLDPDEDFYSDVRSFNQAVKNGLYPYPLSRDLYFVINPAKVRPETLDFLHYVLNEGQAFVSPSAYINLSSEDISTERQKLEKLLSKIHHTDTSN